MVGRTVAPAASCRNWRRESLIMAPFGDWHGRGLVAGPFRRTDASKIRKCTHKRIMLLFDEGIAISQWVQNYAVERSYRTANKATRSARPDGRGACRQHGEGGRDPEHHAASSFQINRGTGACNRGAPTRP